MRLLEIRKPLMTGSDVKHLQRLLRAAGMKPGPLDGEFGPRTAAACNHYKWRIGYAGGNCHPVAGGLLIEFLAGKRRPTARMRLRAAARRRKERQEHAAQSKRRAMRLRALAIIKGEIGTTRAGRERHQVHALVGLGRRRLLRHRHLVGVDPGGQQGVQARRPLGEHGRDARRREGRPERTAPARRAAARAAPASSTSTGTRTPTTPSPASASRATRS